MSNSPLGQWEDAKRAEKGLAGSQFRPDVTPILKAYQGNFQKYVDLIAEKGKLKALLDDFMSKTIESCNKCKQLMEALAKIEEQDGKAITDNAPKIKAFTGAPTGTGDPKADLKDPNDGLNAYNAAYADFVSARKTLWDQVVRIGDQRLALNKKVRDDFKAKSDLISNGLSKLESDADKQEAQAKQILTNYQKIALQLQHADWVDKIRAVAAAF